MNVTFMLEWQSIVNLIASEDYNKIFKKNYYYLMPSIPIESSKLNGITVVSPRRKPQRFS